MHLIGILLCACDETTLCYCELHQIKLPIALECLVSSIKCHLWGGALQTCGPASSYPRCSRSSTDPSGSGPPRSCGQSRCRSGSWSDTSPGSTASSRCPRRWSWGWRRRKPPPWSAASSCPGCTASCRALVFAVLVKPLPGDLSLAGSGHRRTTPTTFSAMCLCQSSTFLISKSETPLVRPSAVREIRETRRLIWWSEGNSNFQVFK